MESSLPICAFYLGARNWGRASIIADVGDLELRTVCFDLCDLAAEETLEGGLQSRKLHAVRVGVRVGGPLVGDEDDTLLHHGSVIDDELALSE